MRLVVHLLALNELKGTVFSEDGNPRLSRERARGVGQQMVAPFSQSRFFVTSCKIVELVWLSLLGDTIPRLIHSVLENLEGSF